MARRPAGRTVGPMTRETPAGGHPEAGSGAKQGTATARAYTAYRIATMSAWACLIGGAVGVFLPVLPSVLLLPLSLAGIVASGLLARAAGKSLKHTVVLAVSFAGVLLFAAVAVVVLIVFLVAGAGNSIYL